MRNSAIIFIITAVTIGALSQLLLKKGLNLLGNLDFSAGLIAVYSRIFCSTWIVGGLVAYGISLFFWLYALSKVDLSFAYPFLAFSYVLVLLLSWIFLGENIPTIRIIGVVVICAGVYLVAQS